MGGGGWEGWGGYKANLSPAKLKLADIGLELSLAITRKVRMLKVKYIPMNSECKNGQSGKLNLQ